MGLFDKFMKREQNSEKGMSIKDAQTIIQKYGALIEEKASTQGCAKDSANLPYTKDKIKSALIIGLKSTSDNTMKEYLKTGYLMLSDWQDGVGNTDQGIDFSKMDLNGDPMKLLQDFDKQAEGFKKWQPIIEAEQKQLENELEKLGF